MKTVCLPASIEGYPMTVGRPLKSRIDRFLRDVGEPYVKVEQVCMAQRARVRDRYIPAIIHLDDDAKARILQVLENSWNNNRSHGNVRRWGRAARGIAEYLLMPTEMDQVEIDLAADVVVRVSRWYHTNRVVGLWKAFIPYVDDVVRLAWGDIEPLYGKREN